MQQPQRRATQQQQRSPVYVRPKDPNVYLYVQGKWYCYNRANPNALLGSGAMGDVYLGMDCQDKTPVAIKKVKDQYTQYPSIRKRARNEAGLQFRHPHMVEMIGCCEYSPNSGPIYMISKYVHGRNIDEYVKTINDQDNRVRIVCNAMCAVLDALALVHSHNVVHRDIKPSNIMVENDNNVRLMDLGIARVDSHGSGTTTTYIGTPEYSAPEQINSNENTGISTIDATTDIYALGITMYELLDGTNPMKCPSQAETLDMQVNEPLPASDYIPKRIMRVIWTATEKEQYRRYQKVEEFKAAILEAMNPKGNGFVRWIQENIVLFSIFATMIVAIIAASIILIVLNGS